MNKNRLLLIISIVLISLGGVFILSGTALTLLGKSGYGDIFMGVSGIFGLAALVLLIIRLTTMSNLENTVASNDTKVVVKVVDVKDIPKTQEEKLYEQYEDLYKRNLITKEELDLKRKELLGK